VNFLDARKKLILMAAITGTCLLGANPSPVGQSAGAAVVTMPHRRSTVAPGGGPRRVPYASPPASAPRSAHPASPRPSLRERAPSADKHWEHNGWIKTGAIERHHFWLTGPFDHFWHARLFVLRRERLFWWRHHRLYDLYWLGQGWEYADGWYYGHHPSTRPTSGNSTANSTVAENDSTLPAVSTAGAEVRPSDVALRNQALIVLGSLQLTDTQWTTIRGALDHLSLAGDAVDSDVIDSSVAQNPSCGVAINHLYRDLVMTDDDQAAADQEILFQLQDRFQFNAESAVVVSDDARVQAQVIFDTLTPRQIAQYMALRGQIVPDPVEILMDGLDQCRHLTDPDFQEYSRCLSQRIAILGAGLDDDANQPIMLRVKQLLAEARPLSDRQFAAQKNGFQQEIQRLLTGDAIDVITHAVQWDLASFMANPQAKAMMDVRSRQTGSGV
jgi:hypothetical protein